MDQIAPQIARQVGLQRCLPQTASAAMIGATLMVAADFWGVLVGGPILMIVLLCKNNA